MRGWRGFDGLEMADTHSSLETLDKIELWTEKGP